MALVRLDLSPPPRVQRVFGISLIATGLVLGLMFHFALGARTAAIVVGAVCLVLGLVPLVATGTAVARWVFVAVSVPALVIGNVVGVVMVTVFFYLLVTPIGLVLRVARQDPLHIARREGSRWIESPPPRPPESYERQF